MINFRTSSMTFTALAVVFILFSGLLLLTFHLGKFEATQLHLLNQLKLHLQTESQNPMLKMKETLSKEFISEIQPDMVNKVLKELEAAYLPDQRQDNSMKLEFKYMLRDAIQKNITRELRKEMKDYMKEAVKEVVKEGYHNLPKYPMNLCSADKNLPPGQKVLAYTVFGTRKLYYEGIPIMLREQVASSLYSNWNVRIYHDALITPEIIAQYADYPNLHFCDARKLPKYGDQTKILGKFWRNIPIADDTVDVFCSRDLDSALLTREEDAVREWLKTDKILHTMRDFPQHQVGMLAGMWCFRPELNRTMSRYFVDDLLEQAKSYKRKTDQPLLNKVIWDNIDIKKNVLQHDSYQCKFYNYSLPFPTQRRDNMEFVGCPGHVCSWKNLEKCPIECRPKDHQDWEYC